MEKIMLWKQQEKQKVDTGKAANPIELDKKQSGKKNRRVVDSDEEESFSEYSSSIASRKRAKSDSSDEYEF